MVDQKIYDNAICFSYVLVPLPHPSIAFIVYLMGRVVSSGCLMINVQTEAQIMSDLSDLLSSSASLSASSSASSSSSSSSSPSSFSIKHADSIVT